MECKGCCLGLASKISNSEVLEIFRSHGVIPRLVKCPACGTTCTKESQSPSFLCGGTCHDGCLCSFKVGEARGTWAEKCVVRPKDNLRFLRLFMWKENPQRIATRALRLRSALAANLLMYCLEVCEYWLGEQERIGGCSKIVEIGEVKCSRRTLRRGRLVRGMCVFGALERQSRKLVLVPLERRNRQTLLDVIKEYIHPESTIYSKKQYMCGALQEEGYRHIVVNDLSEFATASEVHTDNIDKALVSVKSWILRSGNNVDLYPKYLARYLFNRKYPERKRFHRFLKVVAQMYPHPNITA